MGNQRLIVMAKNPVLGKVKTRLAATIGHKRALMVYQKLLQHTYQVCVPFASDTIFYFTDYVETSEKWGGFKQDIQVGDKLGVRMSNAFNKAFEEGKEKVVIIGTDCIEINSDSIDSAFKALDDYDVVIGPAEDGGYYLLGMKKMHQAFFLNKRWSTETVFIDTIEDVKALHLSHKNLPTLTDIDTEKDLIKFGKSLL